MRQPVAMRRLIVCLLGVLAAVLVVLSPIREVGAADVATPVEAETFDVKPTGTRVVTDTTLYSNGQALKFSNNTAIAKEQVNFASSGDVVLMVRAGQNGGSPKLRVSVNGTFTAAAQAITNSGAPQPYTFDVNAPSGIVTIGVKAANTGLGRYPFVDIVTFAASGSITDTVPPETTITSGPSGSINGTTATFEFTSNEPGSTFQCQLLPLGSAPTNCTSPIAYSGLTAGTEYTFSVGATDASGNIDTTPATSTFTVDDTAPGAQPFPGQRWYPLMGVYAGANQGWVSEPGLIDNQYAGYVGSHENAYLDLGDGDDERYYFCGGRKVTWKDALVDPTLVPTSRAQAQDPNWSNYKWNSNDIITQMLDSSSAIAAGKAKMCIFVATTATSVKNPVPAFMMNDPRDLTWTDGQGKDHVRLDKQAGYETMADFLIALTKKYGNDPRIASITHGEYYTNSDGGGLPADLDYDAFRTNIKQVWSQAIAASPRDVNGDRVPFIQGQPIVAGGFVTATDIANIGVGASGSEAQIFSSASRIDNVRKQLYGVVPLTHQVNTDPLGSNATWNGTPNPWGYTNGQSVPIRYEHVAWYFGSQGKVPLDSLMMRDDDTYQAQWHEAYTQFGPNGTQVVQWGQIPNFPPN
jgi:hypothetical protein